MKRALPLAAAAAAALAGAALAAGPAAAAPSPVAGTAGGRAPIGLAQAVGTALAAAQRTPALLHAGPADAFTRRAVARDRAGTTAVHLDRTYHGLRVVGGDAVLRVGRDGTVLSASQTLRAPLTLSVTPAVRGAAAAATAVRGAGVRGGRAGAAALVVWARTATPRLAWESVVTGTHADGTPSREHVVLDAVTSRVLDRWDEIETGTGYGYQDGTVSLTTTRSSTSYQLKDGTRGGMATYDLKGRTSG
ncbi:MAG TPA: M4 family metallopeptidase, partial [Kineosporiaceae bacterium]|nr:M4 family metallopeptidase [Kineosporiaceae bacterium]